MRRLVLAAIAEAFVSPAFAPAAQAQAPACTPRVPDSELVKPGTLVMSTNPTLPPLQFVNAQGQLQGMRIELGNEIARRLCLTPPGVRIAGSAKSPSLPAGRGDRVEAGIRYTEERARMMQMIRYENNGVAISAARGNPRNIASVDGLAGLTIGVELGGFEERQTRAISEGLVQRGLRPMNIRTFDNFAVAFQALRAGQVEAVTSIDAVAAEYDRRGDFPRVLHGLNATPAALAFRSRALATEVSKVLQEMLADGSLTALFDRYGVGIADRTFAVAGPQ